MTRPTQSEYDSSYQKYVELVPEGNFLQLLDQNTAETLQFFKNIDPTKHEYRYAEGKWTIKDVFLHIIDTERGYAFRAICCVRGDDQTPLWPLPEDVFAANVDTSLRTMEDLMEEFKAVRLSFRKIFETNPVEKFSFLGNGYRHKISGRALGYIGLGHVLHHTKVVVERYL
jgi:DinB superfamily